MKHNHRKHTGITALISGLLCMLLSMPVIAQEDELKDMPGFVDFGDLSATYGEPKVSINIGGTLLQFVGLMGAEGNPETSEMLSSLKGVRVQIFSTEDNASAALSEFDSVKSQLRNKGWEPVVQINDEDERVLFFLKMNGQKTDGMAVMIVDDEEAVFVNIIGQLDPTQLGKVMETFDVDIDDALDLD